MVEKDDFLNTRAGVRRSPETVNGDERAGPIHVSSCLKAGVCFEREIKSKENTIILQS